MNSQRTCEEKITFLMKNESKGGEMRLRNMRLKLALQIYRILSFIIKALRTCQNYFFIRMPVVLQPSFTLSSIKSSVSAFKQSTSFTFLWGIWPYINEIDIICLKTNLQLQTQEIENQCNSEIFHFPLPSPRKKRSVMHWVLWVSWDTDGASQMWIMASIPKRCFQFFF